MARKLEDIIAHLRACIADGSIRTTLIQTEDLAALCDAAAGPEELNPLVQEALKPRQGWKVQPFAYYAAHFLVGSGLTQGDIYGHMKGLASAMLSQYDIGVEHGRGALEAALKLGREAVVESFDHAETLDDKMLAEGRLRDIDDALAGNAIPYQ